jgi:serine protease inhibitor
METTMLRIISTLLLLIATSLQGQSESPRDTDQLVRGGEDFCAEVYQRLARNGQDNVVYSPWSLRSALAMLRSGARAETADELDRVLRLPSHAANLGELFGRVENAVAARGTRRGRKLFDFAVSNRAWPDIGTELAPGFVQDLRQNWDAPLKPLDFRNHPEPARVAINREIASATNDRIKELLKRGDLTAETRFVLTNALWLRAAWADQFLAKVRPAPFHVRDEVVSAMMMRGERTLRYGENDEVQVASLPLAGRSLDFTIVLPKRRDGLQALERKMSGDTLREWVRLQESGGLRRVAIAMPRFKIKNHASLTGTLKAMGLHTALSPSANYAGISTKAPIIVSDVIQGAEIEVNEYGLEAAAATAVILKAGSIADPKAPTPFVCDHPFWWMIRDRATGAILFSGRLIRPELAPSLEKSAITKSARVLRK